MDQYQTWLDYKPQRHFVESWKNKDGAKSDEYPQISVSWDNRTLTHFLDRGQERFSVARSAPQPANAEPAAAPPSSDSPPAPQTRTPPNPPCPPAPPPRAVPNCPVDGQKECVKLPFSPFEGLKEQMRSDRSECLEE